MLFPRILFFVLCLKIATSGPLRQDKENLPSVFQPCDENIGCRANSFCARRGCDGMICMCDIGYQPSQDVTECVKVVELYRSCADENTRCRGPLAYCDSFWKTCHCIDGYIPASDNIRCKKAPKYNLTYAMLGEGCGAGVICQDSNQQVCSLDTSKCTCREGLKPASNIDLNAEPFLSDECRPADFNLETELDECKKPVIIGIALIGQHCNTDNNCPDNSKCKWIGCKEKQCRCINGTAPTGNMEKCKPAAVLHETCNESVVCFGAYTACVQGKCSCSHGSIEGINKQCKASPIPGLIEFAALGEECNDGADGGVIKMCESAMCIEGVCSCPPTMREMTFAEMLNNPSTFPTCISINGLTEELSAAEYELQCVTLPDELADFKDLKHSGVQPSVTARWDDEPQIVLEDNVEPSEVEVNDTITIIEGVPDANNSANFSDVLMGDEGNSSLGADEIGETLFSLNESLSEELLNASKILNSANASLDSNVDAELASANETVNYLLENDFDAADFNESFDADYLPGEESFLNDSIDIDSLNDTQDMPSVDGSLDDTTNSSFIGNLSNDSYDVDILNSSLSLDNSNSSLDTESSNNSLDLDISNSSVSNSSFDEMTVNSSLDFESSNLSNGSYGVDTDSSNNSLHLDVSNGTLSDSSFDETTLNSSLDFESSNSSHLNDSLDLISSNSSEEILTNSFSENVSNSHVDNISNSSLRNESLNDLNETQALNMSAGNEVSDDDVQMANESNEMNGTTDEATRDLLEDFSSSTNESLELFSENVNQSSANESLDLNDTNHSVNNSNISKNDTGDDSEVEMNDLDQANETQDQEVLNSDSTLHNTTEVFDMESLTNASSISGSLEVDTVNGSLELLSEDHEAISSNETIREESMNGTIGNEAEDLTHLNHNENASTGENITIGSEDISTSPSSELTTNNPSISTSTHAGTNDFDDVLLETTTELGNTFDEYSTSTSAEETTSEESTDNLSTESEMENSETEFTTNSPISNSASSGTNDFETTTTSELDSTPDELSFYTSDTEGVSDIPYSEENTLAEPTGDLSTEHGIENLGTDSTEATANPLISSTGPDSTNDFDDVAYETTTGSGLGDTFTEQSITAPGTKGISDIPNSEESTGNLTTKGGMEERLQEESPDLGLAISEDGSHFIGSSGDEFEPISYNDDADEEVNEVDELVAKGSYNNRNLLEKCDAMDSCPALSQCLDIGCGSSICVCLDSYGLSEDKTKCIPGNFPPVQCRDIITGEDIRPNEDY